MAQDFKDKACETTKSMLDKNSYPDPLKAVIEVINPPGPLPKPTECQTAEFQKKHMENVAHTGANTGAQTGAQKGPPPVKR